ncbi:helix-turn-helix domain-containing protein [Methylobacter psychrophilus]|uniref:helix-turn-helix domain-containing protein n=1 Tax=Methylobacter psychrophilus TaxID=96941 RepID=UPI0021D4E08C|nr:helix-turn-helix domain-containing protein [Methylobacter psychrophilus]
MYNQIFFTNILRILDEKGITKEQLSKMSGVSMGFICDLTNGKSNPSLRIMENIADALDISLPALLEETDMDSKTLEALTGGQLRGVAEGYERVSLILPSHQAFIAKQWAKEAKEHLKKNTAENL